MFFVTIQNEAITQLILIQEIRKVRCFNTGKTLCFNTPPRFRTGCYRSKILATKIDSSLLSTILILN